jgi:glycosyltransferase involved in cell wall biosynthesis
VTQAQPDRGSTDAEVGALDTSGPPRTEVAAPTLVHVTTVPMSLAFLSGQVSYMRSQGFRVHVVSSPGPGLSAFGEREGASVEAIAMRRAITPVHDLVALYRLWRMLRHARPDIVHSHTPKGGLLGMMAATLARTPVRVYHIRGLAFVTESGFRRRLLRLTEWISCALAHRVVAVSHSMRSIAVDEGLCPREKIKVLLGGSGNGVDATGRFKPLTESLRVAARAEHGIPEDALVVGFVGRLARDKGIVELAAAWKRLREELPGLHLLVVGWNELEPGLAALWGALHSDPRVHLTGPQSDMPRLYAAMDVVALPTYREGFPNVALEAAAMRLPIVATSVPGCVDAVRDGVTGTLVPARDVEALTEALHLYLSAPSLRASHGEAGRRRVLAEFRREAIWEAIAAEYRDLLGAR